MGSLFLNVWVKDLLLVGTIAGLIFLLVRFSRNERWQRAIARVRRDRLGLVSAACICLYLLLGAMEMFEIPSRDGTSVTLLSSIVSGIPSEDGYSAPLAKTTLSLLHPEPLNGLHLLGTDALGKDVLVQTLRACKTALIIGGLTSLIYIPIGALLGIFAGYFRGWVDDVIQYVYTVLYSIPQILLLISVLLVLGEKSLGKMAIALSIAAWVGLCRLIRGETLRQTERTYISGARALGQSHWKIMTQHLLPNVMHLVIINLVLGFSDLVLAEALLSYLGVGSPIGTPSWGNMIDGGRGELSRDPVVWWNLASSTFALFGLVLSLNIFGDSLRKAFDPRR